MNIYKKIILKENNKATKIAKPETTTKAQTNNNNSNRNNKNLQILLENHYPNTVRP